MKTKIKVVFEKTTNKPKYKVGDILHDIEMGYFMVLSVDKRYYSVWWFQKQKITGPTIANIDNAPGCSPVWKDKISFVVGLNE